MILRERGIYCLPNGRELVVLRNENGGTVLYGYGNGEPDGMGEFLLNQAGRLVYQGKLTAWDISNLTDTGRTCAHYPRAPKSSSLRSERDG